MVEFPWRSAQWVFQLVFLNMNESRYYRPYAGGLCLAGTVAVAWFDYLSGYEISIFPLYAIPVGFMTWAIGTGEGALLALTSAALWWAADHMAGDVYSAVWIGYVNAAARAVFFLFVVLAFSYGRRTVEVVRRQARSLTGPVPVCTRCRRLCDPDGHWSDFESYLRTHTTARPFAKVCPDCARRVYAEEGVEQ
jgi:hypothetical protein